MCGNRCGATSTLQQQRQQGRDGAGEVDDEQVVMWWRQGSQHPTQEPQYSQEAGGASTAMTNLRLCSPQKLFPDSTSFCKGFCTEYLIANSRLKLNF